MTSPDRDGEDSPPTTPPTELADDEHSDSEAVMNRARCVILQQILAHDSGVLAFPELQARNPDLDSDALQTHLDQLLDHGLLTIEPAPNPAGNAPLEFFAVTTLGIETLKRMNIYDEIAVWREVYNQVPTPDALTDIEEMERPTPNWYETEAA